MTMRAARIHRTGGPEVLELDEVDEPEPRPGELLVRVRATSVNHRDIWIRRGHPHPKYRVPMPAVLGIDLSGDVVAVGTGVEGFTEGDRVTVSPYLPCGRCEYCRRARPQYCPDFDVYHGTYAELAIVPSAAAIKVGRHVPDEALASFSNSYITAWQMLVTKADVGPDDTVFVWAGTSGLGFAAIEIARLSGARVIASAGSEEKISMLQDRGVELVVHHHEPGLVETVLEATGGLGATIVFEHVGRATWDRSLAITASGGAVVTAGATSGDDVSMDVTALFVKQLRILGSRLGTMDDAMAAVRQLEGGRFEPIVGAVVPLSEIERAHRMLEAGSVVGKIVVKPA
jgi:NADPH:quinone reductase-like Zn-dependent oxidoreductase